MITLKKPNKLQFKFIDDHYKYEDGRIINKWGKSVGSLDVKGYMRLNICSSTKHV